MNENRKLIEKLIPYINSNNPIRRKGIINMIRNIMLDDYYWDKLVDNWDTNGISVISSTESVRTSTETISCKRRRWTR